MRGYRFDYSCPFCGLPVPIETAAAHRARCVGRALFVGRDSPRLHLARPAPASFDESLRRFAIGLVLGLFGFLALALLLALLF